VTDGSLPEAHPFDERRVARLVVALLREALKDPGIGAEIKAIAFDGRESKLMAQADAIEPLIDAREAAKVLGMSAPAVRAAAFRGTLPSIHVGRLLRFRRSNLLAAVRPG
jgi:excisionase family DNA binding protein